MERARELNRLDLRNRAAMNCDMQSRVIEHLNQVWSETAGLIVLDQVNEEGWGVVTPRIRDHLASLARANPQKLMFIDSRRTSRSLWPVFSSRTWPSAVEPSATRTKAVQTINRPKVLTTTTAPQLPSWPDGPD